MLQHDGWGSLRQSPLGEQDVQGLSVIGVSLSVEEYPVLLQQDLGGRVDETWFSVVRRVKNLPSHLVGGPENDEAKNQHPDPSSSIRPSAYMLKTETADRAPEYHCRL